MSATNGQSDISAAAGHDIAKESAADSFASPTGEGESSLSAVMIDGRSLTLAQAVDVARGDSFVHITSDARGRMRQSVSMRDRLLATGESVYGMTTGFGDSVGRSVHREHSGTLQRNLIIGHMCGTGEPAGREVVRATMLVRANCLARGNSGIRPEVLDLLLALLNRDLTPIVPSRGSLGASGDLIPLSYVAAALLGQGTIECEGTPLPADEALARHGLEPVELEPREGLAIINGTSFGVGYAALALVTARRIALAADSATAMAVAALRGNSSHFDERIHRHKGHPGQERSAHGIRDTLRGADPPGKTPLQDPYSLRCAPHVIGVLHDTLTWAETWVEREMNASTDNPLLDPDANDVLHGGNFYAGHVGQAMDAVKVAAANVADLFDRQVQLLVDEKFNRGLTPNLVARDPDESSAETVHHGMKASQIACSALTAETLQAAAPATVFSRSSEAHNQDKVSMGTTAARQALEVIQGVTRVLAIHLLAVCQALDIRGDPLGGSMVARLHAMVRTHISGLCADRPLDADYEVAASLIVAGRVAPPLTSN